MNGSNRSLIPIGVLLAIVGLATWAIFRNAPTAKSVGQPLASIETTAIEHLEIFATPDRSGVLVETSIGVDYWDLESGEVKSISRQGDGTYSDLAAVGDDAAVMIDLERRATRVEYDSSESKILDLPGVEDLQDFRPLQDGRMLGRGPDGFVFWNPDDLGLNTSPHVGDYAIYDSVPMRWLIDIPSQAISLTEVDGSGASAYMARIGYDGRIWATSGDDPDAGPVLWRRGQDLVKLSLPSQVLLINELPNDVVAVTYSAEGSIDTDFVDRQTLKSIRRWNGIYFDQPIVIDDDTIVAIVGYQNENRSERRVELWRTDDLPHR